MRDFAILINSCDAYSDLWPTFFQLLKINWPNVDKKNIYLNTETTQKYESIINVTALSTPLDGQDQWGKRLINSLSSIKEDYVIVLMDDFYLRNLVPTDIIDRCIDTFEKDPSAAVFYLSKPFVNSKYETNTDLFEEIPKNTNYRLNSAPALWRKSKLLEYTEPTDNPWAWEYFGTCRTNKTDDKFFCIHTKDHPVFDYAHAIYRGKWLEKDMAPLIKKYDLDIDMSVRGIVKEGQAVTKRSIKWKIKFIMTGVKMVGFDAIKEILKDVQNKRRRKRDK